MRENVVGRGPWVVHPTSGRYLGESHLGLTRREGYMGSLSSLEPRSGPGSPGGLVHHRPWRKNPLDMTIEDTLFTSIEGTKDPGLTEREPHRLEMCFPLTHITIERRLELATHANIDLETIGSTRQVL